MYMVSNIISVIFGFAFLAIVFLLPIIIGFTAVRSDANRLGQPGWLWAALTIPLGWLALLVYAILRWFTPPRS